MIIIFIHYSLIYYVIMCKEEYYYYNVRTNIHNVFMYNNLNSIIWHYILI